MRREKREKYVSSGLANGGCGVTKEKQSCGRKIAHLFSSVQASIFGHMNFSAQISTYASYSLFSYMGVTSACFQQVTVSSK